jgi:2-methylisocitrate lyase-like PEP mutase family enzyme
MLRDLLGKSGVVVVPGVPDALTGKIVEALGFQVAYLGGYMTGALLCTTEPLTTFTEFTNQARYITSAIKIPLIADGDAGFGDAIHTWRAVKEYEKAGIAAMHIEDQVFPKRAGYHKGTVHIISKEEMITKIEAALAAREDKDFMIIARTDAPHAVGVEGLEETIQRSNAYADAGADLVMPEGLKSVEEHEIYAKNVKAPAIAGDSDPDSRTGFKVTPQQLEKMGTWKMVIYDTATTAAMAHAVMKAYTNVKEKGTTGLDPEELTRVIQKVEELIGLPHFYEMEERTAELRSKEKCKH